MKFTRRAFFLHLSGQVLALVIFSFIFREVSLDSTIKDQLNRHIYRTDTLPDNSRFVIIEIDDRAFDWFSSSLGSMRISIAKLIMHLEKYKPRALIAFFLFYGKGLPQENLLLTAAVEKFPDTFLLSKTGLLGEYFTPLEAYTTKTPLFGFFEPKADRDGIIRSIPVAKKFGDFIQHDLSSQIVAMKLKETGHQFYLDQSGNKFSLKNVQEQPVKVWQLRDQYHLNLRYFYKPEDCLRVSAFDVIKGQINLNFLKDKIILIEGTASVFQNLHKTPFGLMSMGTLFLNATENLHSSKASEDTLEQHKAWTMALLILCLAYILLVNTRWFLGILGIALMIVIFFQCSFMAYQVGIILPYTQMLSALILPALYHFIAEFVSLYRQSNRWFRLASLDPYTGLYSFKFFSFHLQRLSVIFRKKKRSFVLGGFVFYHPFTKKILSFAEIDQRFIKTIGKKLSGLRLINKTAASDPSEGIIYFVYEQPIQKFETQIQSVVSAIEDIMARMTVEYKLCTRYLAVSPSSPYSEDTAYALMQKLQILFKKFPLNQEMQTSAEIALPQSSKKSSLRPHKDVDLDFLSLLLQEDQKEMEHIKSQLKQSVQEYTMAQKFSAMGQLSSYYAHELKNPLHNMLNCFEIIEDETENESDRKQTLSLLKSELKRVIDLTKKMGAYFKPSEEKPVETVLNAIIQDALNFLKPTFEKRKVEVVTEFDAHMPTAYLVADQMKQVFLNFFLNAMDAMPDGGTLIIATFYSSSVARIVITDTGKGIDPLSLQKIFHAFYTTKENQGSGLGLFICYNIIKNHGGQIKVNSTPDKGTCFEIILPL